MKHPRDKRYYQLQKKDMSQLTHQDIDDYIYYCDQMVKYVGSNKKSKHGWIALKKNWNRKELDMNKKILNFEDLPNLEKEIYLKDTWCNQCNKVDLGITNPIMYKENGKTYISGNCMVCGEAQIS